MSHEPLDYFTPPVEDAAAAADRAAAQLRVVRRVRRVLGFIALAVFIFAGLNSGDGNPLQWPTAFVFMACLGVYFIAVLVSFGAHVAVAIRKRSQRPQRS
jgi:hypothetical protein